MFVLVLVLIKNLIILTEAYNKKVNFVTLSIKYMVIVHLILYMLIYIYANLAKFRKDQHFRTIKIGLFTS